MKIYYQMPQRARPFVGEQAERPVPGDVVHYATVSYRIGPRGQYLRISDDERRSLLKISKALGIQPRLTT